MRHFDQVGWLADGTVTEWPLKIRWIIPGKLLQAEFMLKFHETEPALAD